MELGAVYLLSYGDPATRPTCHRIPGHPSAYREETGRLGGEEALDSGGRHVASVWGIPYRRPEGGDGGTPGKKIPQPGALREAPDGGAMDNRTGDRAKSSN